MRLITQSTCHKWAHNKAIVTQSTPHTSNSSQGEYRTKQSSVIIYSSDKLHQKQCSQQTTLLRPASIQQDVSNAVQWPAQHLMSSTCDHCSGQLLCSSVNQWPSNYGTATSNLHYKTWKERSHCTYIFDMARMLILGPKNFWPLSQPPHSR